MRVSIVHSVRCGSLALLIGLSAASSVDAQSIIDARRVEFRPSADHSALDANGVALVDGYSIQVFVAGGATAVQTADLGKPVADSDGMIRVDFVARLATPLTPGVIYEVLVEAVGPGGSSGGTRSNTFSFAAPCAPSLSSTGQSFTAAAGTGSSTVTVGATCPWTASSNASWIAVTAGATSLGTGTVTFSVTANTAATNRSGTLTIAGMTFTVTQAAAPCSFSISPTSQSFTAAAGTGSSTVTTAPGCAWTAASNVSWLSITAGATGSGNGTVTFSVAARTTTTSRTGTLTIAGKTFTVTQAGVTCTVTVSPLAISVPSTVSSGTITVTTTSTCAWSSSSPVSWITLTGSGPGNGSASYTVAANTGTTARSATLTVAGKSVTVNQGVKPTAPTNVRVVK